MLGSGSGCLGFVIKLYKKSDKGRTIALGEPITIASITKNMIKTANIGQSGLVSCLDKHDVVIIYPVFIVSYMSP
jgi:hypothetical protein